MRNALWAAIEDAAPNLRDDQIADIYKSVRAWADTQTPKGSRIATHANLCAANKAANDAAKKARDLAMNKDRDRKIIDQIAAAVDVHGADRDTLLALTFADFDKDVKDRIKNSDILSWVGLR